MDDNSELREAIKTLSDVLNRSGRNVDVRVQKVDVTTCGNKQPRFMYYVSAEIIESIAL